MKAYGSRFATEFSKKQIGVIYKLAKTGDLKVERFIMSNLYDLADYFGYDDNRSVADAEASIKAILDDVFSGNIEAAQEAINAYTTKTWELMGKKSRANASRELVK